MSTYLGSAPRDVEVLLICKRKGHIPESNPCKSCRDCLSISPRFFPGKAGQHLTLIGCFIIWESSWQSCHLVDWETDEFIPFTLLSSREKSAFQTLLTLQSTHILGEDRVIFKQCELEQVSW